jgi:hypothetical protein
MARLIPSFAKAIAVALPMPFVDAVISAFFICFFI